MKDDIKQFHRREMLMDPRFGPVELTELHRPDLLWQISWIRTLPVTSWLLGDQSYRDQVSEALDIFQRTFG